MSILLLEGQQMSKTSLVSKELQMALMLKGQPYACHSCPHQYWDTISKCRLHQCGIIDSSLCLDHPGLPEGFPEGWEGEDFESFDRSKHVALRLRGVANSWCVNCRYWQKHLESHKERSTPRIAFCTKLGLRTLNLDECKYSFPEIRDKESGS